MPIADAAIARVVQGANPSTVAPATPGQGGADASAPPQATPDTAAAVTAAREAHAAAKANADAARERASRAGAAHRQAVADQQAIIARAAAGTPVKQPEIARAATAVAEARDAMDYTNLVAGGATVLAERAEIALRRAQASHATASHVAALDRLIARAADIDAAFAALQGAITAYDDAVADVALAASAIHSHNQGVDGAKATNATLAALPPNEAPTCRPVGHIRAGQVKVGFLGQQDGYGGYLLSPTTLIAGRLRSAHGIAAPAGGTQ